MRFSTEFLGVLLTVACALPGVTASAHDPGLSSSRVRVGADRIDAEVAVNNADFIGLLPGADLDRDGVLDRRELAAAAGVASALIAERVAILLDGRPSIASAVTLEIAGEDDDVVCNLWWPRTDAESIEWRVDFLGQLARGHRQYSVALDRRGEVLAEALLSGDQAVLPIPHGSDDLDDSRLSLGARFLHLGVEHILIGYDHILFLLGLLFVCAGWRQIALTITAFTAAHSLTLAAASLQVVRLPSSLVEATIALSIVYVGAKNIARRGQPESRSPFLITFLFGLVHGFGFASVLAELGLGDSGGSVVWPLLAFNVGVELGQLLIASVVVPLLWFLARRRGQGPRVALAGSLAITGAGVFWLIERTLLA